MGGRVYERSGKNGNNGWVEVVREETGLRPPSMSRRRIAASLTPMVDVVFLLIIFFLVSSHLARRERRMPVDLPTATTAARLDADEDATVVTIDADGQLHLDGRVVAVEDLARRIDPDTPGVRLRCDRRANYAAAESVMSTLVRIGVADVRLGIADR